MRSRVKASACPPAGEHYLQSHIESKAERVAADGRPLGRGGVSRGHGFSPSTRVGWPGTGPGHDRLLSVRFGQEA